MNCSLTNVARNTLWLYTQANNRIYKKLIVYNLHLMPLLESQRGQSSTKIGMFKKNNDAL